MSPSKPGLSVIVPVRNEMENIRPLVHEIHAALADVFDLEVIYVDDGSTDDTLHALRLVRKEYPLLKIYSHRVSAGQSAAVHTGVTRAVKPWIGVLDGDGQNDPRDFLVLWEWVRQQDTPNCMAIGRRRKRQDTALRKYSSVFAARVRALLLRDAIPDSGCGLKILSRKIFMELPYFDHMHRFMPVLLKRQGAVVASIPISHRPRVSGASKYGTIDRALVGIFDIVGVMWLQRRCRKRETVDEN